MKLLFELKKMKEKEKNLILEHVEEGSFAGVIEAEKQYLSILLP